MRDHRHEAVEKLLWITVVLSVAVWAFALGSLSVSVEQSQGLESVHREYNHIQIYEDGSYIGETIGGEKITGCISTGLCSMEGRDDE